MIGRIILRLIVTALVLGSAAAGLAYWQYQTILNTPFALDTTQTFSVKRGDNITTIANNLATQGLIKNALPLIYYTRLNGKASALQAGDYLLNGDMNPMDFIDNMIRGKIIVNSLTIVEGQTLAQLLATLANNTEIEQTLNTSDPDTIANLMGIDGSPEGWFLPDTYHFHLGTTDFALLKRMHQAMQHTLDELWENRADNLPLNSPYEALILASIIEKETGLASERAQVAGVFIRRLQQNMRLQTDPSVIYGAKDYNGVITKTHLRTDTPYNTYTRYGLPPTPIALAGKAAIEAALHPADGDALYFVANGTGGHTFSATYAEHRQAVAEYRRQQRSKP